MEALSPYVRPVVALTAFLLLFFAIVNASAGRYVPAGVTLVLGLAGTFYVVRTRRAPQSL